MGTHNNREIEQRVSTEGSMLTDKQAALKTIKRLPEDASFQDILYALRYTRYIRESIAEGIKEAEEGETIPHEEIVRELAEWAASAGHPLPEETSTASASTSGETRQPTRRQSASAS